MDQTIEKLARDLKPVRVVSTFRLSILIAISITGIALGLGMTAGLQEGWQSDELAWKLWVTFLGLLGLIFGLTHRLILSSIPGRSISRESKLLVWLASIAVVGGTLLSGTHGDWQSHLRVGLDPALGTKCMVSVFLFALAPFFLAARWISNLASTQPRLTASLVAATSGVSGATGIMIHCGTNEWIHTWVWHFSPIAILIALGMRYARRIIRW